MLFPTNMQQQQRQLTPYSVYMYVQCRYYNPANALTHAICNLRQLSRHSTWEGDTVGTTSMPLLLRWWCCISKQTRLPYTAEAGTEAGTGILFQRGWDVLPRIPIRWVGRKEEGNPLSVKAMLVHIALHHTLWTSSLLLTDHWVLADTM